MMETRKRVPGQEHPDMLNTMVSQSCIYVKVSRLQS